jgi:hypothetical protein
MKPLGRVRSLEFAVLLLAVGCAMERSDALGNPLGPGFETDVRSLFDARLLPHHSTFNPVQNRP